MTSCLLGLPEPPPLAVDERIDAWLAEGPKPIEADILLSAHPAPTKKLSNSSHVNDPPSSESIWSNSAPNPCEMSTPIDAAFLCRNCLSEGESRSSSALTSSSRSTLPEPSESAWSKSLRRSCRRLKNVSLKTQRSVTLSLLIF